MDFGITTKLTKEEAQRQNAHVNTMTSEEEREEDSEIKEEQLEPDDPISSDEVSDEMVGETMVGRLIPGFESYMEDDAVDNIPLPAKEEGATPYTKDIHDEADEDPSDDGQVDIVIEVNEQDKDNVDREVSDEAEPAVHQLGMSVKAYRKMLRKERDRIFEACDYYQSIVRNDLHGVIGQESLSGMIKNAVTGLVNITGHTLNLFKTSLLYGFRNFKRSEMTEYVDSNSMTMKRLYNSDNYPRLKATIIPIPRGMSAPYVTALEAIKLTLKHLNMLEKAKEIVACTEAVYVDLVNNGRLPAQVVDLNKRLRPAELDRAFKAESKIFSEKNISDAEFGKMFASMKEYENVVKDVTDMDIEFRTVTAVYDHLQKIDQYMGKIVALADRLTRNQLDELVKMTRLSAELFDIYANVIQDLNRLNHNLAETTKTIRSTLEM